VGEGAQLAVFSSSKCEGEVSTSSFVGKVRKGPVVAVVDFLFYP